MADADPTRLDQKQLLLLLDLVLHVLVEIDEAVLKEENEEFATLLTYDLHVQNVATDAFEADRLEQLHLALEIARLAHFEHFEHGLLRNIDIHYFLAVVDLCNVNIVLLVQLIAEFDGIEVRVRKQAEDLLYVSVEARVRQAVGLLVLLELRIELLLVGKLNNLEPWLLFHIVIALQTAIKDVDDDLAFVLGDERLLDHHQVLLIRQEKRVHVLDTNLFLEQREVFIIVRDQPLLIHLDLFLLVALIKLQELNIIDKLKDVEDRLLQILEYPLIQVFFGYSIFLVNIKLVHFAHLELVVHRDDLLNLKRFLLLEFWLVLFKIALAFQTPPALLRLAFDLALNLEILVVWREKARVVVLCR